MSVLVQPQPGSGSRETSGARAKASEFSRIRLLLLAIAVATVLPGCNKPAKQSPPKIEPAHVEHHVDEQDLNRVTLTAQAEERLGIQLAETLFTEVQRRRTVGGEVLLPPGQTIMVSAPVAGTLFEPSVGTVPVPGNRVEAGQAIFTIKPLLTPERDVLTPSEQIQVAQTKANVATTQIDAERQIESAKISVDAAQIAYDRAVQLLKGKAGSQRTVDEASAMLKLAQEALTTAETRYDFLAGIKLDEQAGELESREIESPVAGVLQSLSAAAGETVVGGKALFSVITTNRVWIRVPVYVGQWREIDARERRRSRNSGSQRARNQSRRITSPRRLRPTRSRPRSMSSTNSTTRMAGCTQGNDWRSRFPCTVGQRALSFLSRPSCTTSTAARGSMSRWPNTSMHDDASRSSTWTVTTRFSPPVRNLEVKS